MFISDKQEPHISILEAGPRKLEHFYLINVNLLIIKILSNSSRVYVHRV